MSKEKNFSDEKNQDPLDSADENEDIDQQTSQLEYDSDSSTDSNNVDKCPICLVAFQSGQEIGKPRVCQHAFCFPCIHEWSKVVQTCPIDRKEFKDIDVYDDLEFLKLLRSVTVNEKVSLNDFTNGENEFTPCEVCNRVDREDVMLLCDGCDKGFHMDCLDPPMLEIPEGNWYCTQCESDDLDDSENESEEEEDINEVEDLRNEIEHEIGDLPETRLRSRQQPQIIRTMQSERIRNAILARRSLRGALEMVGDILPSSSSSSLSLNRASQPSTSSVQTKRKAPTVRKRKTRKRKRRATKVVEYELKDGQKFPIKTTRIVRTRKRKTRKIKRARKTTRRSRTGDSNRPSTSSASSGFKNMNSNVYELQRGRQLAGLTNFNIFEPTNMLDYVPDEDIEESVTTNTNGQGGVLSSSIVISYNNPIRRQALIKKRVIDNFSTTSSGSDLLDSILGQQTIGATVFKKLPESSKLISKGSLKAKQSTNDNRESANSSHQSEAEQSNEEKRECENLPTSNIINNDQTANNNLPSNSSNTNENEQSQSQSFTSHEDSPDKKSPQKKKKKTFDMFEDSNSQESEEQVAACPNFSIYGSVNRKSDENLSKQTDIMNEENVDLVQMSDNEHNLSDEIEPAVIRSQPASPDLDCENDTGDRRMQEEERSYTPPLLESESKNLDDENSSNRKKKDRRHRRRELERYNVRDRLGEKPTSKRAKDRFGRNRTRSRTRSRSHNRNPRRRSRSRSNEHERNRHKKSKTPERRKRRSPYSRSLSRRKESSIERNHKNSKSGKHKKTNRRTRTRSRSLTPKHHRRENDSRRRERSNSDKSKRKRHKNRSKEKSTKEIYTSGQNILVSVNFTKQEEKRSSRPSRSRSKDKNEPVVDITAKKKINVSSKPVVAIIDLARSPFAIELTPDYKKDVIELSDSEGEKHLDSTKLYDPFEILNSPSNENVSSSQNSTILKTAAKVPNIEPAKSVTNVINKNLPVINNEENLVSSSSSVNIFEKNFPSTSKAEVLQNETVQQQHQTNIESPYSPGNDDAYDDTDMQTPFNTKTTENQDAKLFDELFGSSSPPTDSIKNSKKSSSSDPNKYLNKLKRQERVIEEVKLVIKPYYSKRSINKDQYKEIMRKAVPKICHSKTGEINPTKIKHLIDSYVRFYTHKKKRSEPEEIF